METRLGGFWLPYLSSDDVDGECEADEITFADFYRAQSVVSEKKDFLLLRTINQAKDLLEKNWEKMFAAAIVERFYFLARSFTIFNLNIMNI